MFGDKCYIPIDEQSFTPSTFIKNKYSQRPPDSYVGAITREIIAGEQGLRVEEFMLRAMYLYKHKDGEIMDNDFFCIGSENQDKEIIYARFNPQFQRYEISWLKKQDIAKYKKIVKEGSRLAYSGIVIP